MLIKQKPIQVIDLIQNTSLSCEVKGIAGKCFVPQQNSSIKALVLENIFMSGLPKRADVLKAKGNRVAHSSKN